MGRVRCPTCDQSIEEGIAACNFCGRLFDPQRAAFEEQERMRRAAEDAAVRRAAMGGGAGAAAAVAYPAGAVRNVRGLTAGDLLSDTLSIYGQNFIPFSVIGALVMLPAVVVFAFVIFGAALMPNEDAIVAYALVTGLLAGIAAALGIQAANGAVTYGVVQHVRGRPASLGECLSVGFSRMFPVLGVAIVNGVAVALGLMACCVPGLIVMTIFAVAAPVAVIEKPGVFASMGRSNALTEGYRWSLFGAIFLIGLINWIIDKGATFLQAALPDTVLAGVAILGVAWAVYTISAGLNGTLAAVAYYRLRAAKESVDVEEIASVFD